MSYVRPYMWIVILTGIAVVRYRYRDRWAAYRHATDGLTWRDYARGDRAFELTKLQLVMYWPVVVWLLVIMIPFIILDVVFGPK